MVKGMLLRVGIDKGTGGTYGPIFADGSFEFIPIPEGRIVPHQKTYDTTLGRSGQYLSEFVPDVIRHESMHYDPEFETLTYGDPTSLKRKCLLKLEEEDLLVFYAGLKPYENREFPEALYIIGYFTIKEIVDFEDINKEQEIRYRRRFSNNAHIIRADPKDDLVIVVGDEKRSRLLDKAILISERGKDRAGRPLHVLSKKMEKKIGITGGIQRSTPRYIAGNTQVNNLKRMLNII